MTKSLQKQMAAFSKQTYSSICAKQKTMLGQILTSQSANLVLKVPESLLRYASTAQHNQRQKLQAKDRANIAILLSSTSLRNPSRARRRPSCIVSTSETLEVTCSIWCSSASEDQFYIAKSQH